MKKTNFLSFESKKTSYDKGYNEGIEEGMFQSSKYTLSLIEKTKSNHWWFISQDIKNGIAQNDNFKFL